MKFFIASDIHGSAFYCKKMINAFLKENADKMLLLGDILYHGPRNELPRDYNPKKVISMLNEIKDKIICVKGNCDTEVDQMVLHFPILSEYNIIFDGVHTLYMNHGHKSDCLSDVLCKGSILLCGHTHVPAYRYEKNYLYVNPGSVSIPKENSQCSYLIWENGVFSWKNIYGEIYNELKV